MNIEIEILVDSLMITFDTDITKSMNEFGTCISLTEKNCNQNIYFQHKNNNMHHKTYLSFVI